MIGCVSESLGTLGNAILFDGKLNLLLRALLEISLSGTDSGVDARSHQRDHIEPDTGRGKTA